MTYRIKAPVATHWRKATCEEVDCREWRQGWISRIDTRQQAGLAIYIRRESGRRFTEEPGESPGIVLFRFAPGQMCFAAADHRIRVDRPELFIVSSGDWRGNPRGEPSRRLRADHWVESFAEHQQALADRLEQG